MWTRDVPIIKNEGFKAEFKAAVDAYILGDWTSAMRSLKTADAVCFCDFVAVELLLWLCKLFRWVIAVSLCSRAWLFAVAPAERLAYTRANGHYFSDGNNRFDGADTFT
eukprot:COSAG02_NODE_7917_length_2789_cov_55.792936_3_plen_109_part_00